MTDDQQSTRQRILRVTRELLHDRGLSHLTIQGVADELGLTKQAVLYWFPSKNRLLQELFFEAVEAESNVLTAAVENTEGAAQAMEAFLREGLAYYRENLPRFRLTYLLVQLERSVQELIDPEEAEERLYPVTGRIYGALEEKFRADPRFPDQVDPRDFAVSLHMSLLGHVCMLGVQEATGDSFRQTFEAMIDSMLGVLEHGLAT